jgi:hypothetical protein
MTSLDILSAYSLLIDLRNKKYYFNKNEVKKSVDGGGDTMEIYIVDVSDISEVGEVDGGGGEPIHLMIELD